MSMKDETAVEMFVGGLVLDPNTQAPVVVLKDESGQVHLPIWIGVAEATSIASAIKELNMARPLTHDLMAEVFAQLDVRVQRIVITELKDSTYFAELVLSHGDKALILDSRPSDAIAIALRASAPIYVMRQVLEQAQITFSEMTSAGKEEDQGGEPSATEAISEQTDKQFPAADFKSVDKEKWNEMLAELDPDDFKYKT